jgi:hypothetical protein
VTTLAILHFNKMVAFNGPMGNLIFYLIVQLNLIFGIAGLVWPDKFMPLYGMLMFPWPASYRAIRMHGIVSIAGYLLVLARLLALV